MGKFLGKEPKLIKTQQIQNNAQGQGIRSGMNSNGIQSQELHLIMERISPFSFSTQELLLGNGEKLSIFIFIPVAFLGVWGAALHFHLLPRNYSWRMESSSPYYFSLHEINHKNEEQLFIWISPMILQSSHHMAWSDYPQTSDSVEGSLQTALSSSKTNKAFQGGQQR